MCSYILPLPKTKTPRIHHFEHQVGIVDESSFYHYLGHLMSATTLTPDNQSNRTTYQQRQTQQARFEQEMQAFFQQAEVKSADLDEIDSLLEEIDKMFDDFV